MFHLGVLDEMQVGKAKKNLCQALGKCSKTGRARLSTTCCNHNQSVYEAGCVLHQCQWFLKGREMIDWMWRQNSKEGFTQN